MQATEKNIAGANLMQSPLKGVARAKRQLRALGLKRFAFPVVPDATGFYMSTGNETVVAEMLHSIESRKGFMVITGEVGLGKTTLSRRMLMELEKRGIQTALVFNTFHQGAELLSEINKDFGIGVGTHDLQSQLSALNEFLLKNLALGINCAIIIDDAQQLSIDSLELVRQVSNLETDSEKLVQILLVGQPELETKLRAHRLRQLRSRIVLKYFVSPYTLQETKQYVQFKLAYAGGQGRLRVTEPAFRLLQRFSGGNPRRINILMDRCLYATIAYDSDEINRRLLKKAAREITAMSTQKSGSRNKVPAQLVVLLLLVALLGLLLLMPGAEQRASKRAKAVPNSATLASVELPLRPPDDSLSLNQDRSREVESFLTTYQLEQYSPEFAHALNTNGMDGIAEEIAHGTGLRLVSLGALPDGFGRDAVLKVAGTEAGDDKYLLFWRPVVWTQEHFYYYYREVQDLQKALRLLGHYFGNIDGLAGPLTGEAIRRFQASVNVPPSGVPDTATLFLLEYLSARAGPSDQTRKTDPS